MQTSTKIYTAVAVTALMVTTASITYAMFWQGNGQGQNTRSFIGMEQRSSFQGMNRSTEFDRHTYSGSTFQWQGKWRNNNVKIDHNPGDMVQNVAPSNLSDQEKLDLAYQYSEEMVARDAYAYFATLYDTQAFRNIADSEQQHMDAVKVLLDRYNLPVPTTYGELETTFAILKAEGEKGLKEALEVGIKIEILDIKDIVDTIKTTDNDDLKIVFANIGGASYNHMRGFIKALEVNGLTTTIDYSDYLSQTDLDTRGSLKAKLSDKLTSEWVTLPAQASASGRGMHGGRR